MKAWKIAWLALLLGCGEDPIECCIDSVSGAIIEGFVVNAAGAPLADTPLRPAGRRYLCRAPEQLLGPAEGEARTDAAGFFRMLVASFLGSPGSYCVDVLVGAGEAPADTVRGIAVEFYEGEVKDTTRVVLRVGG